MDKMRMFFMSWCITRDKRRLYLFLYLFAGLFFLRQHIKLAMTSDKSRRKPTTSDTISTTRLDSTKTDTQIQLISTNYVEIPFFLKDGHVRTHVTCSGNKMHCNIVTTFVQTNREIPLHHCLFVLIRTERDCFRVHEKSNPSIKSWRETEQNSHV